MARGRSIKVEIIGDASRLGRTFRQVETQASGLGRKLGGLSSGLMTMGRAAAWAGGAAAVGGLILTVHEGIAEFNEMDRSSRQAAAAIRSTGGAAGMSLKQMKALGMEISNYSGYSDEAILSTEALLSSFTKIQNHVGKGNQIFTRATKAVVDFAARTGRDPTKAAIVLGKALEDPAKKLAGLARAGIVFSVQQQKQIKGMVEHGKLLQAQKIILEALATRYGGAARALGDTLGGKIRILRERFRDLAGELVGRAVPAFTKVVGGLTNFVRKLASAQGLRAKLNIIWTGLEGTASKLFDKLRSAVMAIDWSGLLAGVQNQIGNLKAKVQIKWQGIKNAAATLGSRISDAVSAQLGFIDWTKVGKSIGDGVRLAVEEGMKNLKAIGNKITDIVTAVNWEKLGRAMGPGLATAMVTGFLALLDPSFWIRNWDLALAVGLTVLGTLLTGGIGGVLGKLGGKLAAPFARIGGQWMERIGLGLIDRAPRLAGVILETIPKLFSRAGKVAGAMFGDSLDGVWKRITGFFSRHKFLSFTLRVLGFLAAITVVKDFVKGALNQIAIWVLKLTKKFLELKAWIADKFSFIPGIGHAAEVAKKQIKSIQDQIDALEGKDVFINVVTVRPGDSGDRESGDPNKKVKPKKTPKRTTPDTTPPAGTGNGTGGGGGGSSSSSGEPKWKTAFNKWMAISDVALQRAGLSKGLKDDLRVLESQRRHIEATLKLHKNDVDLQGKLVDVEKQILDLKQQEAQAAKDARQAARDQATTAAGAAFGGPLLSGPLGDFLRRFGSQGATINPALVLQDMKAQNQANARNFANITKIQRRGAPKALVSELLGMGPEGAGLIATIANAPKKIFDGIVAAFKMRQSQIEKETVQIQAKTAVIHVGRLEQPYGGHVRKAAGGIVPGSGHGDTVPAMLTPGELVLNRMQQGGLARVLGTANTPSSLFGAIQGFSLGGWAKTLGMMVNSKRWGPGIPGFFDQNGPLNMDPHIKRLARGIWHHRNDLNLDPYLGSVAGWVGGKAGTLFDKWSAIEHRRNVQMGQQLAGTFPGQKDRHWHLPWPLAGARDWLMRHAHVDRSFGDLARWAPITRGDLQRALPHFAGGGVVGKLSSWLGGHPREASVISRLGGWIGRQAEKTPAHHYLGKQFKDFAQAVIPTPAGVKAMGLFARDIGLGYLAPPAFGLQSKSARARAGVETMAMVDSFVKALRDPVGNAGFLAGMMIPIKVPRLPGIGHMSEALSRAQRDFLDAYSAETVLSGGARNLRLPRERAPRRGTEAIGFRRGAAYGARLEAVWKQGLASTRARQVWAELGNLKPAEIASILPPGISSPGDLVELMHDLFNAAKVGKVGRFWYEKSGQSILREAGGDVTRARMIARLAALYSPRVSVEDSIRRAFTALEQFESGGPITVGLGKWQSLEAAQILSGKTPMLGRKSENFFMDLMRGIDPKWVSEQMNAGKFRYGSTNDVWVQKAFGYKPRKTQGKLTVPAPSKGQYDFMSEIIALTAEQLGWSAHEAQAALWTTTKARFERRSPTAAAAHIGTYLERNALRINYEALSGDLGQQILKEGGWKAAREYSRQQNALVKDVFRKMRVVGRGAGEQIGLWGEEMNPGFAGLMIAPRVAERKGIWRPTAAFQNRADEISALIGYILHQYAVGQEMPYPRLTSAGTLNSVVAGGNNAIKIAEKLSRAQIKKLSTHSLNSGLLMLPLEGGWVFKGLEAELPAAAVLKQLRKDVKKAGLDQLLLHYEPRNVRSRVIMSNSYEHLLKRAEERVPGIRAWADAQRKKSQYISNQWETDLWMKHRNPAFDIADDMEEKAIRAGLYARGGSIPGFGSRDTVPAMLTPGEVVLNRRQQRGLSRVLGLGASSPQRLFDEISGFQYGGVIQRNRSTPSSYIGLGQSAAAPGTTYHQENTITVPPHFIDTEWAVERGLERATWRLRKGI